MSVTGKHLYGRLSAGAFARTWLIATILLTATPAGATCNVQSPTRIALFGDLHVHTGLSFDAYISSIRLGPNDAYRYAKGEPLALPGADRKSTRLNSSHSQQSRMPSSA